jgi:hypothetical protein
MNSINALIEDADWEEEDLYACGLLYRASRMADITEEYIKSAAVVDTASPRKYAPHLTRIRDLRSSYRALRDSLTFGIKVDSPENPERVERKLAELLELNDFTVTGRNPRYTITARITMTKEEYSAGTFIRPGIRLRVEQNGNALLSHNKNYDRYGHRSVETAYNRAFLAIEEDLETNFMLKLSEMLGR